MFKDGAIHQAEGGVREAIVLLGRSGKLMWEDFAHEHAAELFMEMLGGYEPDLTSPWDVGCLLAMLREAEQDPFITTRGGPEGWWTHMFREDAWGIDHACPTEGEAIAAALIALGRQVVDAGETPPAPDDRELDDDDLAKIARSWEFHRAHQPCGASKAAPGWWCTRKVDHDGPCAAVDGFPTGHPPEEVAAADVEMYVEHIRALMADGVNPTTACLAARAGVTIDDALAVLAAGCESGRLAAPPSDRPWVGYRFRSSVASPAD